MNVKIFTIEQSHEWADYLARLPNNIQDIYASPFYYEIYDNCGHGTAEVFIYEENDRFVMYPYLRNPINALNLIECEDSFSDIQGAYGYNGPLTNCSQEDFLRRFSETFTDYCSQEKIIAEFTRFNPVIANHRWLFHAEITKANEVVNIDLSPPVDILWTRSYDRDVRRIINKAEEIGYKDRTVLLSDAADKDVDNFRFIYLSTLDRNRADQFYYFNEDYFSYLRQKISLNTLLSVIYVNDKPIGGSINPFLGVMSYGFLGGSLEEYKKVSPFTFMIHKICLKLKELGIKHFLLGGGNKTGDSIFQYKRSFSVNGVMDFFIGTKVYNRDVYDSLCKAWINKYPDKVRCYGHYFLKYRY